VLGIRFSTKHNGDFSHGALFDVFNKLQEHIFIGDTITSDQYDDITEKNIYHYVWRDRDKREFIPFF